MAKSIGGDCNPETRFESFSKADEVHWNRAVRHRVVAELAVIVEAPTLDGSNAHRRTRMAPTGGDGGSPRIQSGNVDGHQAVCGRIVAELAEAVGAPTSQISRPLRAPHAADIATTPKSSSPN